MPEGYSGTPLGKKLSLKSGMRVWFDDMPDSVRADIEIPDLIEVDDPEAALDAAHIFVTERADMESKLTMLRPLLAPAGFVWVSWPKKASKVPTDITEDTIRGVILPTTDLVDVKVCAVDRVVGFEADDKEMGTVNTTSERYESLDAVRGFAVMGILLMNIVAFAMPSMAYINPLAWGTPSVADLATWAINFVLVDGKMRGLFSVLFGASMLLVIDGADRAGENGRRVHLRRMAWLLVFGLMHFYLIWFGDILTLYALAGMLAVLLARKSPGALIRWAIGLFLANFVVWLLIMGSIYALQFAASQPGAPAEMVKSLTEARAAFGAPGSKAIADEVAAYSASYADAVAFRAKDGLGGPLFLIISSGFETLGLIALGMALFRNGFLRGEWDAARYRRTLVRAYAIGIPPLVAMATFCWSRGFDPVDTGTVVFAASAPFRLAVMVGHAALIMLVVARFSGTPLLARVAATGRAAFTNYLGTSVLMTLLFYGYGGGLFGTLPRWQIYLVPPLVWGLMLLWSKPWLDRYRYGPLEWLWRSLARGRPQPMRR